MPATEHGHLRNMDMVHHSIGWIVILLSPVTMHRPDQNPRGPLHETPKSKETCGEQLQTTNRNSVEA